MCRHVPHVLQIQWPATFCADATIRAKVFIGVLSDNSFLLQSFHSRCKNPVQSSRRLYIPPDSEFIMTTEDVRQSSAMSAIQDLMVSLHQALEQEKKVTSKES